MEEALYTEVAIGMKNGSRKMGLLIAEDKQTDTAYIKYVPSDKTKEYTATQDPTLIEALLSTEVTFIDSYLR